MRLLNYMPAAISVYYVQEDLVDRTPHCKVLVCDDVFWGNTTHCMEECVKQPHKVFLLFLSNEATPKLDGLTMVINSNEWCTRHLVHVCHVCCVKRQTVIILFICPA